MRISDHFNFVYIAPARSGSTSVRDALNDYANISSTHISQGPFYHHIDYKSLEKHYPRIKNYKKFTVMRDPFERTKSLFNHHLRETNGIIKFIAKKNIMAAKFIFWLKRIFIRGSLCATVTSQVDKDFKVLLLEDKKLIVKLNAYLNLNIKEIPHLNKIDRNKFQRDRISELFTYLLFADDIVLYKKLKDHQCG